MSFYHVLRRFELLSGLQGEGLTKWSELCKQAMDEVKGMLIEPEKKLTDSQQLRLSYAAGALAFYKYCMYVSVSQPQRFEAGEVRITTSDSTLNSAKKLFEEECKGVSDILKSTEFYFGRVKA